MGGGRRAAVALLLASFLLAAAAAAEQSFEDIEEEEGLLASAWGIAAAAPKCRGTLAECLDGGDLELGDDATHRRMLYPLHYISYGALKRDSVPCSVRGASYYNCRPGAQLHPYTRGCSAIARCRSY